MYLVYKTFQGRNLSKFFGGILKINDLINTFWQYLTFSNGLEFIQKVNFRCMYLIINLGYHLAIKKYGLKNENKS